MNEYTPTTEEVRDYIRTADRVTAHMFAAGADTVEAFDRWLAAHDAEVRAEAESDPAKDERVVRYLSMVTPLGYQSALTVVQQMTVMIQAETEARLAGVVAEEPEWEYGVYSATLNMVTGVGASWIGREHALKVTASEGENYGVCRRKAGSWVPVKQEGDEP